MPNHAIRYLQAKFVVNAKKLNTLWSKIEMSPEEYHEQSCSRENSLEPDCNGPLSQR